MVGGKRGRVMSEGGSSNDDSLLGLGAAVWASTGEGDLVPAGTTVGRYFLGEPLGRGGMGVVYAAHDPQLDRSVALKLVQSTGDPMSHGPLQARLLREAQLMARLSHPNVVPVFDLGLFGDRIFVVMDRVEGVDARAWLAQGTHSRDERLRVFIEAGRGLAAAHALGIVHRDFKPANVLIGSDGRARVTDFGLAKSGDAPTSSAAGASEPAADLRPEFDSNPSSASGLTETGALLGTPAYMAPEQARRGATPESDQFAFCVSLHQALLGSLPSASLELSALPAPLAQALARGLSADPRARFSSMTELLDALSRTPPSRPLQRWPAAKAVGGAVALGVLTAALWPKPTGAVLLGRPAAVLACPPLEVVGVDEPSGWLGAAAASLACMRAQVHLGGSTDRIRVPADLLGLPSSPRDDLPADPFSEPTARARALVAAQAQAAVILDGQVERRGDGFRVALRAVTPSGRVLGRSEALAPQLFQAAGQAVTELAASGAILDRAELDADLQPWFQMRQVSTALIVMDVSDAIELDTPPAILEQCRRLETVSDFGPLETALLLDGLCHQIQPDAKIEVNPTALSNPSDAASLALTAMAMVNRAQSPTPQVLQQLAQRLAQARAETPPRTPQAWLALAQSEAELYAGDISRAHEDALRAGELDPRQNLGPERTWHTLAYTSGNSSALRIASYWAPADPHVLAGGAGSASPDEGLRQAARAAMLAPSGYWAEGYATQLIGLRRLEEARGVAARTHSAALDVDLAVAEAHFAVAKRLALTDIEHAPRSRLGFTQALLLAGRLLDVEHVLGQPADFVADLYARYLEPEPPVSVLGSTGSAIALAACTEAPPAVAVRCLHRLQQLAARGDYVLHLPGDAAALAGAASYAEGDLLGAARAWRPLVATGGALAARLREPMVAAFEAAGEGDLAAKLDAPVLSAPGHYGGADLAWAREAHRAEQRGDRNRARELAQQVVDAWSVADETAPAVAEMRQLVERTR